MGGRAVNAEEFEDLLGALFGGGVRPSRDVQVTLTLDFTEAAKGVTRTIKLPASSGGRSMEVNIPAGMDDGARLRVDGAGQPGNARQPAGHLYVKVNVRPHPRFSRDGPHLHLEERVGMETAALGGSVSVPTLEGGAAEVRIPSGTQPGDTLRLRGRGLPVPGGLPGVVGDLYVHLAVAVPRSLSPRQRELLEEFQKLSRK